MKNKLEKIHLSIDNETKCYVSYDDYKKMEKSYKDKLRDKSKIISKKEYKIGDEVKWCGLDWYVIELDNNNKLVKLMLKNTLKEMKYSDDNSNDWNCSNVRFYLNNEFINKLDKDKLQLMNINYDERLIAHDYVAIPTLRDIERLPMSIRKSDNWYWTMTASYAKSEDCSNAYVFFVATNGYLDYNWVTNACGLRPVVTLSTDELE